LVMVNHDGSLKAEAPAGRGQAYGASKLLAPGESN
jgi:hypothetical protein